MSVEKQLFMLNVCRTLTMAFSIHRVCIESMYREGHALTCFRMTSLKANKVKDKVSKLKITYGWEGGTGFFFKCFSN